MTAGDCPLVVGESDSWDFPATPGVYDDSSDEGFDVYVSKLDPTGSSLVWSTYLGGSRNEGGYATGSGQDAWSLSGLPGPAGGHHKGLAIAVPCPNERSLPRFTECTD